MVAISLYRGNLHKVLEAPRRWVMPKHRLSLHQFRALLARRDRALHALMASSPATSEPPSPLDAAAPSSAQADGSACPNQDDTLYSTYSEKKPQVDTAEGGGNGGVDKAEEEAAAADTVIGAKDVVRQGDDAAVPERGGATLMGFVKVEQDVNDGGKDVLVVVGDKTEMAVQILNAEEEIKRHHSMQASQIHVPVLAQLEASTIAGTMMRQPVQRPGSDVNSTGDLEGDLEDAFNPQLRSMYQTSTTSPSAGSPLARPAYDST